MLREIADKILTAKVLHGVASRTIVSEFLKEEKRSETEFSNNEKNRFRLWGPSHVQLNGHFGPKRCIFSMLENFSFLKPMRFEAILQISARKCVPTPISIGRPACSLLTFT